jgi:hypothetical protein
VGVREGEEVMEEYDPKTCITAGELRAARVEVPDSIPDCGWVPKASIRLGVPEGSVDGDGNLVINTPVEFTEPMRWISFKWRV